MDKQEKIKNKANAFLFILIILLAGAAFYYIYSNYFKKEAIIVNTAVKSYELYSSTDKQKQIVLYLGDPDKEGFKQYKTTIFDTKPHVNQIKQALLLLLKDAPAGYVSLIPQGVALREVYLDANNFCYVDFSQELSSNSKGGTTGEYLTAYSVVNTICSNFNDVKGVKILISGKEAASISGHFSLREMLKPEY